MDIQQIAVLALSTPRASMLGMGCLLAGGMLTAIGAWQRSVVMGLVANGLRTKARAVDDTRHHHDTTILPGGHHLVWEFQTVDGTVIHHEGLADALQGPELGETARVIYDPADPHNARLETFAERTLAWAMFLYSGLALLALSLVSLIIWAL
ncbi:MAG: DUF3592 domain-containing protein [Aquihabitans sp.]